MAEPLRDLLLENELALCIADAYPVTPVHSLVIPRRHRADGLAQDTRSVGGMFDAHSRLNFKQEGSRVCPMAGPQPSNGEECIGASPALPLRYKSKIV